MKKWLAGGLFGASGLGLLLLPGVLRLPVYRPTVYNGVKTMRQAIRACRQTGLQGWNLVAYAQQLVAHKFALYTTLNLWHGPDRAFLYGMGYCTQYNLALKHLLDQLGCTTRAVFALKVRVRDNAAWTMGHTWLQVTVNGETRDVCAGRVANAPGQVHFEPLSPVLPGPGFLLLLTHLGMILYRGVVEWWYLLGGRSPAAWTLAATAVAPQAEDGKWFGV